ncbi:MAG: hypothetical protein MJZ91_07635 [Bacteroidales bacterium]|nr:hypothetical protein [Bacteroidales bacterium]
MEKHRKTEILKKVSVLLMLIGLAIPTQAQVFMVDEDAYNNRQSESDINAVVPYHFVEIDQENNYAPLGDGLALLIGLGSAYALAKRKKH